MAGYIFHEPDSLFSPVGDEEGSGEKNLRKRSGTARGLINMGKENFCRARTVWILCGTSLWGLAYQTFCMNKGVPLRCSAFKPYDHALAVSWNGWMYPFSD
jgi:hypothetical protein